MKTLVLAVAFSSVATSGLAADRINGKVEDHYITTYDTAEVIDRRCEMIDVPVYGTRRVPRNGGAAGNALLGMIIGGAVGKGLTGKDNGAAAGSVTGGIIGADQGSKSRTEEYVKGYRSEKSCTDAVTYKEVPKNVYSHSTLRFTLDGKRYTIDFSR